MEDVHWNDIYYEVSSTGLDRHGLYSCCTIKAGKQYVSVKKNFCLSNSAPRMTLYMENLVGVVINLLVTGTLNILAKNFALFRNEIC